MMETSAAPQILDHMSALADGLRSRVLLILERQELTVSEICAVVQLPQSTVSRHLKTLADGAWVVSRPDGTRRLYRMPLQELEESAAQLWELTREHVAKTPHAQEDARRLHAVLSQQRTRSQDFFARTADRWDGLRDAMFGSRFHLFALVGLLDPDWVVADLGCGTGPVSEALAPVVAQVVAVDGSEAMLAAARDRLQPFDNVETRLGELEALPVDDDSVDAATLILVLHHLPDPAKAVSEVARVLRPGGKLLLVDMLPHDRQEYPQEMGHVWMGFSADDIERLLISAGLTQPRIQVLPSDPSGKGPSLFAAVATRPANHQVN